MRCGREDSIAELNHRPPVFVVIGAEGFSLANSTRDKIPTKNETSILALVYWRNKKRASYFTGGDGNPEVERKVLNHLKECKLIENVKTMKLDHHGSSGENLATWHTEKGRKNTAPVVDIIKPEYVLVTPGDQYEHPCKLPDTPELVRLLILSGQAGTCSSTYSITLMAES